MRHALLCILSFTLVFSACKTTPDYSRTLASGAPALIPLGPDDPVPDFSEQWSERDEIFRDRIKLTGGIHYVVKVSNDAFETHGSRNTFRARVKNSCYGFLQSHE